MVTKTAQTKIKLSTHTSEASATALNVVLITMNGQDTRQGNLH